MKHCVGQLQGINRARFYEIQLGVQARKGEALLEVLNREQIARLRSSRLNDALKIKLGVQAREKKASQLERAEFQSKFIEVKETADELTRSLDHKVMCLQQQEEVVSNSH